MTTIVVTNRKGGVGKTTITVHAAVGLHLRGKRVAIVDTDPQGHVAVVLGLEKEDGLYRIMLDKTARLSDVLRVADPIRYASPSHEFDPENPLWILPSNIGTSIIPYEQRSPLRFKKVLDDMYRLLKLDYVFVDTGPSSNMFDGSVNLAADSFIYATQLSGLSFDGIAEAMRQLDEINQDKEQMGYPASTIIGMIPNLIRMGTRNHRENMHLLTDQFADLIWNPMRVDTTWESAMDNGQTVFSYQPDGEAAINAWQIVDRVEGVFNHVAKD